MKQRAGLYARVSTARQEQEQTIASQLAALDKAAAAMGHVIPTERRYVDDGYSGSRLDRPALDALRDAAADGLIDIVLVHCPDRLARNYVHQQVVLDDLVRRGVEVHFVERPISDRPEDQLLVQMQGVIAEYERAKILERTRRGKLHKVKAGTMLPFTSAPYGYAIERTPEAPQGVVVIDEVEAEHVRAVYRWVLEEGLSLRQVARRLNEIGVPARRKKFWVNTSIFHVLTNRAYAGHAAYGKSEAAEPKKPMRPGSYRKAVRSSHRRRPESQWIHFPIPAIIDAKMQAAVRARLESNKVFGPRNVHREYLLRGLVVCGECGHRMAAHYKQDRGYEYMRYACMSRDPVSTGREQRCRSKCVSSTELDRVVWEAVVEWIRSPQMLVEEVETWRASRQGAASARRDIARLQSAKRRLQAQIERLLNAYQHGALTVEELKSRREGVEAAIAANRSREEDLLADEYDRVRLDRLGQDLEEFAATLRAGLEGLDFAGRQRLVRLLVERVIVTGERVTIDHAIPLSGRFGRLRSDGRGGRRGRDRGALRGRAAGARPRGRAGRAPAGGPPHRPRPLARMRPRSTARRRSASAWISAECAALTAPMASARSTAATASWRDPSA